MDVGDDPVLFELSGRDVDRNRDAVPLTEPRCSLPARGLKHPPTDRDDQAARFECRDEFVGHDDAPLGMAPAQEGLDAGEGSCGEINSGLIHQEELAGFQSAVQSDIEMSVIIRVVLHRGGERHGTLLSGGLGLVERDVGVSQQLFGC